MTGLYPLFLEELDVTERSIKIRRGKGTKVKIHACMHTSTHASTHTMLSPEVPWHSPTISITFIMSHFIFLYHTRQLNFWKVHKQFQQIIMIFQNQFLSNNPKHKGTKIWLVQIFTLNFPTSSPSGFLANHLRLWFSVLRIKVTPLISGGNKKGFFQVSLPVWINSNILKQNNSDSKTQITLICHFPLVNFTITLIVIFKGVQHVLCEPKE